TATGTCQDIATNGSNKDYRLAPADLGKYIRVVVTASNDFPLPSAIAKASSQIGGPVAAKPGKLPGDDSRLAPTIVDETPQPDGEPTEGDTLGAPSQADNPDGWMFNPAANFVSYQWFSCDEN